MPRIRMLRALPAALGLVASLMTPRAEEPALGRRDEPLRRVFTPPHAPVGTYEVYVSEEPIEAVAARLGALDPSPASPGSWIIGRVDFKEAFGTASRYDHYGVARLYGGIRPRVARGPISENGRVVAGVTLISPYPDASLEHLQEGTLIVLVRLARLPG